MLALIVVLGLSVGQQNGIKAIEDPLLSEYYLDEGAVQCIALNTANGARFSTYQWWLLGFVSGVEHAQKRQSPTGEPRGDPPSPQRRR